MKRKAIEKIEPAKTRKKGHIATVQTLDDIAIINVFNDKVLAVRYCINCKTGEHEYWTEKNGWKKGKLITAIEGNWYEWVWMKHDYKYPKIDSEEDRKRLLDITQDKYCTNDVWSRIDHMEYSYDYDIRQTAEHNRRAKINNFMIKAPNFRKMQMNGSLKKQLARIICLKKKEQRTSAAQIVENHLTDLS